jgi:GR25 family glycosyltransferase involved in LPS biosynthesis
MLKDFVSKAFYINLDFRTDRKEHTEKFLKALGIENYERFDAIKTNIGYHGYLFSQVAILEKAIEENLEYVLICDDDLTIEDEYLENFLRDTELFFKNIKDWDVLMLGGEIKELPRKRKAYCMKTRAVRSCPAYLIRRHYFETYHKCLKQRQEALKKRPDVRRESINAADTCIRHLQRKHNWYMIYPYGLIQKADFSDISNDFRDYGKSMRNIDQRILKRIPPIEID